MVNFWLLGVLTIWLIVWLIKSKLHVKMQREPSERTFINCYYIVTILYILTADTFKLRLTSEISEEDTQDRK